MKPLLRRLLALCSLCLAVPAFAEFQAGTAKIDITPRAWPVLVNGGMTSRSAESATKPIHARAIVLSDGATKLAIVVADSCMMPRPLLDKAKALASERTGIAPDHMLIAATHTHTAPSSFGCLGTRQDLKYSAQLIEQLAEAITEAASQLQPAQVGWASTDAAEYTALRRWVLRPDRVREDPFGNLTVRANMHAAKNLDDVTGESGPLDPELSAIVIQSTDGKPIAFLANFSMHYFSGVKAVNPDYFGLFCDHIEEQLGGGLALMSHGCSGDIWRRDYRDKNWVSPEIETYSKALGDLILGAAGSSDFQSDVDLRMAERRLDLAYRVPTKQRLEWAERIVAEMGDRDPKTRTEVYANEAIELHKLQRTDVVVQALRIGDHISIVTTPNETYAISGLKLKLQSPTAHTMTLDLTNGADGYIPPPEQHLLGGYNTWAARSAGLEVMAEPKIVGAGLELLEEITGEPRKAYEQSQGGAAAKALVALKPIAWWRMDEFGGNLARDSSGNERSATLEQPILPFLTGPRGYCSPIPEADWPGSGPGIIPEVEGNRSAHFAGGRLHSRLPNTVGSGWSIALSVWNGMPNESREILGWLVSCDEHHGLTSSGLHLGVNSQGKLTLHAQGKELATGSTTVARWNWTHVILTVGEKEANVYLNGKLEFTAKILMPRSRDLFVGGRSDGQDGWEGRLDEIAVFDRALSNEEASGLGDEAAHGGLVRF
tara:strand:+ start:13789 stop:15936 length:2148 start_codon:yes stop_codon:yes gene_type:complete